MATATIQEKNLIEFDYQFVGYDGDTDTPMDLTAFDTVTLLLTLGASIMPTTVSADYSDQSEGTVTATYQFPAPGNYSAQFVASVGAYTIGNTSMVYGQKRSIIVTPNLDG